MEDCIFDPNHLESPCETCADNMMSVNCEKSIVYYCANYYGKSVRTPSGLKFAACILAPETRS